MPSRTRSIFFLSDNGASAEIMVRDDGHDPTASAGSAASHLCLGPGWSTVANTPFRRHKTWVHEGGIATPLIVHWPRGIPARGELRHDPGPRHRPRADDPGSRPGHRAADCQRRPAIPARPGKSLVPAFARDGTVKHDDLWWAHEGNRAIRVGDWKLVAAGRTDPGSCTTSPPTAPRRAISRRSNPPRSASWPSTGSGTWTNSPRSPADDFKSGQAAGAGQAGQGADPARRIVPRRGASGLHLDAGRRQAGARPSRGSFTHRRCRGYPDSHEKWMHEQFLAAGVAVAGIDVGEAHGSPEGRRLFTEFYRELTEKRGFAGPALPAGPQPRRPVGHELGHREPGQGRRDRRDLSRVRSPDLSGAREGRALPTT